MSGRWTLQRRCWEWCLGTFGGGYATDPAERGRRLLEEALELAQVSGVTREQAETLVEYTFGREIGEVGQEIGQTLLCLMILSEQAGVDALEACEQELERIGRPAVRERIRAKLLSKRLHGISDPEIELAGDRDEPN